MLSEKRFIRQINTGKSQALRDLYGLYKDDLMTLAKALLFDRDLAEDIVHDVFARLVQLRGQLRIKRNLRGYLMTTTANMARNRNRDKKADVLTEQAKTSQMWQPDQLLMLKEDQDRLLRALEQLPYEQREVILLRHYGNLTFKTIGKSQGIGTNTIQGRYRYGLKKLRSLLEDLL